LVLTAAVAVRLAPTAVAVAAVAAAGAAN
jgi:hypothetical protein